jgi:hypothetical protein
MIDFTACLIGMAIGLILILIYLILTTPKYPK